jgi:hypothetical protein
MWTDKRNGMFRFSGSLDPFGGALLNGRLNAAMAALFSEKTPSTCPTDLTDEPDADPNDEWSAFTRNGPSNRAQPRALRALYATCAVYGCAVKFDHCQPHHVKYWENGGFTDLGNLLPLCSRHHHLVHEGGWKLTLGLDRTVTVIYPDGNIQTTGPPLVRRAA